MMQYRVITPSTIYPIAVDAVLKQHLRVSSTDVSEDDLLLSYLQTAAEFIERYIGYPLMTQVVEINVDVAAPYQELIGNVNDLVSYEYYDGTVTTVVNDGTVTGLDVETFGLLSFVRNTWSGSRIKVTANAGYTEANVPKDLQQACRLLVSYSYEVREAGVSAPDTVLEILDRHVLY